jgi:hypothetical protein
MEKGKSQVKEEISAKNSSVSYNLFLDDFREPPDVTWVNLPLIEWHIVRDVLSFKNCIKSKGMPSLVSFDNDLLPKHYTETTLSVKDTGFEACCWLLEFCHLNKLVFPKWIVHSRNSKAVRRMVDHLLHKELSWDKSITWSYKDKKPPKPIKYEKI